MLFLQISSTYGLRHPSAVLYLPRLHANGRGIPGGGITLCKSTSIHSKHKAYLHIRRINDPSGSDRSWGKLALLRIQLRQLRDSLDLGRCCVPFPEHPLQTHTSSSSVRASSIARTTSDTLVQNIVAGRHVASRARH